MRVTIETTDAFGLFDVNHTQRSVNKNHVKRLAKSLQKDGYNPYLPIQVKRKTDGRFDIIDGQHRFEAAKSLGCPFSYMVIPEHIDGIRQMRTLNRVSRTWNTITRIEHYAKCGNENYQGLMEFCANNGITPPVAFCILGANMASASDDRELLLWSEEVEDYCQTKMDLYKDLISDPMISAGVSDLIVDKNFVSAMLRAIGHVQYNHQKFKDKLRHRAFTLVKSKNQMDTLKMLSNIANWSVHRNFVSYHKSVGTLLREGAITTKQYDRYKRSIPRYLKRKGEL